MYIVLILNIDLKRVERGPKLEGSRERRWGQASYHKSIKGSTIITNFLNSYTNINFILLDS
jgi:hypothetical protein